MKSLHYIFGNSNSTVIDLDRIIMIGDIELDGSFEIDTDSAFRVKILPYFLSSEIVKGEEVEIKHTIPYHEMVDARTNLIKAWEES